MCMCMNSWVKAKEITMALTFDHQIKSSIFKIKWMFVL